jgi:anion-transporting  ArsA/GET3 family ATPase
MKQQKIVFITGKGGVGKSSVAAAVALNISKSHKKVLLVELGEESFFADHLNLNFQEETVKFSDYMDIALWNGYESLKRYITHYIKIKKFVDLFVENKVMKALINAAPGLKELSLLGRITSGARHFGPPLDYDYIVVDAYATGHFLALLRAPVGMYEVVKFGPMGSQCEKIIEVIKNKKLCQFLVVSLPESLPIEETLELCAKLKTEYLAEPTIIINKLLDKQFVDEIINTSEFKNELKNRINTQEASKAVIEKFTDTYYELPFIYENNGRKLTDELSDRLESLCKKL